MLSSDDISKTISKIYGNFAIIFKDNHKLIAAVDSFSSIPLYYHLDGGVLFIFDIIEKKDVSERNILQYLLFSNVLANNTLINGVKRILPSEHLLYIFDSKLLSFIKNSKINSNYLLGTNDDNKIGHLDIVLKHAIERIIQPLSGRTLVVSLSGGLDSRIILGFLKKMSISKVICFSFGTPDDSDVIIGRKVAEALGYSWIPIIFTADDDTYKTFLEEGSVNKYREYAFNGGNMVYLQDYYAYWYLKHYSLIPDDSVFIFGYGGDLLAGSSIPDKTNSLNSETDMVKIIIDKWFINWRDSGELQCVKNMIRDTLELYNKSIDELFPGYSNEYKYIYQIESFAFHNVLCKNILNRLRAVEFLGFQWRCPFLDSEVVDFFQSLSYLERVNENLYKQYAVTHLFTAELECLRCIRCTTFLPVKSFNNSWGVVNNICDYERFSQISKFIYLLEDEIDAPSVDCVQKYVNNIQNIQIKNTIQRIISNRIENKGKLSTLEYKSIRLLSLLNQ